MFTIHFEHVLQETMDRTGVCDGYMMLSLVVPSILRTYFKELWTLGVGCLHDFIYSFTLEEVNLKTFNISCYISLRFKDFPVICKE